MDRSIGRSVDQSVGRSITRRSFDRYSNRSVGRLGGRSIGRSVDWSVGLSIGWSVGQRQFVFWHSTLGLGGRNFRVPQVPDKGVGSPDPDEVRDLSPGQAALRATASTSGGVLAWLGLALG